MIKCEFVGLTPMKSFLSGIERQVPFAMSRAINSIAKGVVKAENEELSRAFDKPTPRTKNATKLMQFAKKTKLEAIVGIDDGGGNNRMNARGFKGTIFPNKYLSAQIYGGARAPKRFEKALIAAGVMPAGMFAVFAKRSNALDQHGNIPASKIVQILSWFQAFPEGQGYRANMKKKTKANLAAGKRKGLKWGFAYFRGGKAVGLPDGIWERHYPNGQAGKSFIRPILIYVRSATYQVKFPFERIAQKHFDANWEKEADAALRYALATAK